MKNAQLLNQVTPNLRLLFQEVDKEVQVEVLSSTIRTLEQQKAYFAAGTSKTMDSKHLIAPGIRDFSEAVDAGPYPHKWPVEGEKDYWKDWARIYYFAGVVVTKAKQLGIKIRFGGDWNGNFDLKDQNFYDGVHFEEVK
jgi:peptidoglycan L-alanyl-D-glutamate endopeptidase CwlK